MITARMWLISALFIFTLLVPNANAAQPAGPDLNELLVASEHLPVKHERSVRQLYSEFNDFNSKIRDGLIDRGIARTELIVKLGAIRKDYYMRGGGDYPSTEWVFPVAGYGVGAIDRGKTHGFIAGGYNFFSGNRHGGHPAYDIFIRDRNQDSLDDRTGKAVAVLSMTGGVVVAVEKEWRNGSGLRGGKYIWVYDPGNNLLVYYAHNEELFVEPGTLVRPGDLLATVGRSGLNAAKRRSPTHLHFSVLSLASARPVPLALFSELKQAVCLAEPRGSSSEK